MAKISRKTRIFAENLSKSSIFAGLQPLRLTDIRLSDQLTAHTKSETHIVLNRPRAHISLLQAPFGLYAGRISIKTVSLSLSHYFKIAERESTTQQEVIKLTLSRKHYKRFAEIICNRRWKDPAGDSQAAILRLQADLENYFMEDNSRFDRAGFEEACTPSEKGDQK